MPRHGQLWKGSTYRLAEPTASGHRFPQRTSFTFKLSATGPVCLVDPGLSLYGSRQLDPYRIRIAAVQGTWRGARALSGVDDLVQLLPQGRVALAASGFEAIAIDDGDAPSVICDQTRRLEQLSRESDGPTPRAEHLPEDVVGDRERVRRDPIMGHEQPTAEPLLGDVEAITRGRLRDLREECEHVAFDEPAEGVQALNLGKECRCAHLQRVTTHRCYGSDAANSGMDERHPDNPLIPDVATSTLPSADGVTREMTPSSGKWTDSIASPGSKSTVFTDRAVGRRWANNVSRSRGGSA